MKEDNKKRSNQYLMGLCTEQDNVQVNCGIVKKQNFDWLSHNSNSCYRKLLIIAETFIKWR